MEDVPWLYVAMIFIAFVSWIVNRVQEASAARRQAREGSDADWEELDEYRPPSRAPGSTPPSTYSPPPPPPSRPAPQPEPPQSLGDVFREIERQIAEAKRQREAESSPVPPPARVPDPAPAPGPPPLPSSAPSFSQRSGQTPREPKRRQTTAPKPTAEPPLAGTVAQSARTARLVESRRKAYAQQRDTREIGNGISAALRDRTKLRTALLLKEILDEPVSMRRNSF